MDWIKTSTQLPPEGVNIWTKIQDERGERNVQKLKYQSNLWWSGRMYVYYTPTHWATEEVIY